MYLIYPSVFTREVTVNFDSLVSQNIKVNHNQELSGDLLSEQRKNINWVAIGPVTDSNSQAPSDAISVDLDQTPQNAASDQGLHCLYSIPKFL